MRPRRPRPLIPREVDTRDLDKFMLNAERLMASELFALSTGEEFKAAVALWCRAWKQIPAGSLPNDDRVLAGFSGAGARWAQVRDMAMRGFVLCSDNRWYHPILCEDAVIAWRKKRERKARTAAATAARQAARAAPEEFNTGDNVVPERTETVPNNSAITVPESGQKPSKNQRDVERNEVPGTGTGTGTVVVKEERTSVSRPVPATPIAASPPSHAPPPSQGLAAHTLDGQMTATDFSLWAQACAPTIKRGWSRSEAIKVYIALPYVPVEHMIDAWAAYVVDCKEISASSKFPQRVMHPENWLRERRHEGYIADLHTKQITSINRANERSETLKNWGSFGIACLDKIGDINFDAWLTGSRLTVVQQARAILEIPKPFVLRWLQENPSIVRQIETVTNTKVELRKLGENTA